MGQNVASQEESGAVILMLPVSERESSRGIGLEMNPSEDDSGGDRY